jgi:hypothetical protein
MPCRIGITTDPAGRKADWLSQHPSMVNWRILETHSTKIGAQKAETRLKKTYGCIRSPGGRETAEMWSVYKFEYKK